MDRKLVCGWKEFSDWEVNLVKGKAKSLSAKPGFSQEDIPDIEQELLLTVHRKRHASDSWAEIKASKRTILSRILDNRIRDLIDSANTDKRRVHTLTDSLNEVVSLPEKGQPKILEDYLGDDHIIAMRRQPIATPQDLEIELSLRRRELSTLQRRMSELLKQGFSVTETAKVMGLPRTTLYREIDRLREIFQEEGLQVYVE